MRNEFIFLPSHRSLRLQAAIGGCALIAASNHSVCAVAHCDGQGVAASTTPPVNGA